MQLKSVVVLLDSLQEKDALKLLMMEDLVLMFNLFRSR